MAADSSKTTKSATDAPKVPHFGLKKRKGIGPKFYLSNEQKADLKEAFDLFDSEGTGKISVKDLKVAIRALGFEPGRDEIRRMIAEVDKESTGKLSFNDFSKLMAWKMSERDSREDVLKAFRLFDENEMGYVNIKTLERIARELGEQLSEEEFTEMIDTADVDLDDVVDEAEFVKVMKHITFHVKM